jgi:hypothetical protein
MKSLNQDIYDLALRNTQKIHDLAEKMMIAHYDTTKNPSDLNLEELRKICVAEIIQQRNAFYEKTGCWDQEEFDQKFPNGVESAENPKKRKTETDLEK